MEVLHRGEIKHLARRILGQVVQPWLKIAVRSLYFKAFRQGLRLRCWYADHLAVDDQPDLPPAILRFRVSESLSPMEFLAIGEKCASLIDLNVQKIGVDLGQIHRVLDFGCGCGRVIQWLMRHHDHAEFHGVDVDGDAIRWCSQHFPTAHFQTTAPAPPLPYPSEYFDLIHCLSVFTHLNESMQDLWIAELARVLRPGRVLMLTVHGLKASAVLGPRDVHKLTTVRFVHKSSMKLKGIQPEWYQTTWHSQAYITNRLSPWAGEIRYEVVPDGSQDFVTLRKKAGRLS